MKILDVYFWQLVGWIIAGGTIATLTAFVFSLP